MTDGDAADRLVRRDQLLELLYWVEGEGFPGAARVDALARFLALPAAEVMETLEDLRSRGEVVHDAVTAEYRLTERGRREGAKRFADEFAPLLSQGHGECNDPSCECHSDPSGAAECRAHRQR